MGGQDVEATLEWVKAKGGKVKELADNRVETELEQDVPSGNKNSPDTPQRLRLVNRYDLKKGLPISADVFDAQKGKLLSHTLHSYRSDKATGQLVPHRVVTDAYGQDTKTGKVHKRTEIATYRQFTFTDNLN